MLSKTVSVCRSVRAISQPPSRIRSQQQQIARREMRTTTSWSADLTKKYDSPLNVSSYSASSDKLKSLEKRRETLHSILNNVKVQRMLDTKGKNTVKLVDEDQTVFEAVKVMSEHDIGAVVVSSKGKPRGIFTERDYMTKLILKGRASESTPLKDVTEYKLTTVNPENSLDDCAELMVKKIIRHLPIVGSDNTLVGMMSVRDIAEHMIHAGFTSSDLQLDKNTDSVEDVFNKLGRVSSEECFVQPHDSVLKALELMDRHRIGAVFVLDGQKLVGIFTERDYLHKVRLHEKASKDTVVEEVMTRKVVVVSPAEQIGKCLAVMVKGKFRNLPIVPMIGDEVDCGEYRSVLGIVTLLDVVRFLWQLGVDSKNVQ